MKLLSYSSIRYLLFTGILVLISIPAFYVVLSKVIIQLTDNSLYEQSEDLNKSAENILTEKDLILWKKLDNDLTILDADNHVFHPKPYSAEQKDSDDHDFVAYRILEKKIHILNKDFIVQTKASLIEKEDLVKTILFIQSALLFLILLSAFVLNYRINRKIWRPFYESLEYLKNFQLGSDQVKRLEFENTRIQEFVQLNQSIKELTIGVETAYRSQKEFTENASHELQTPLAILKFKLELLLQEKNLNNKQGQLMDDMNQVISAMEELNKNLLLITRIDNSQYEFTNQIQIDKVLIRSIADLEFMAEAKGQTLQLENLNKNELIHGNSYLLKQLFFNLLRNAIQYSVYGATIQIKLDKGRIEIYNPTKGDSLDETRLFKRFSKLSQQKGNGLGLSIAKRIATLHNMQLNYSFTTNSHCFRIKW